MFSPNAHNQQAGKGDEPERKLLQDVWGEVPSTQTTAIMGPRFVRRGCANSLYCASSSSWCPLSLVELMEEIMKRSWTKQHTFQLTNTLIPFLFSILYCSGAGKTSLLNILAGRASTHGMCYIVLFSRGRSLARQKRFALTH